MKPFYLIIPAFLSLSACGGSSTSPGSGAAFNSIDGALDELEFFIEEVGRFDPTPVANIPIEGSATYEGIFSFAEVVERFPGDPDPQLRDSIIGELDMAVNFGSDTLTGSADNFFRGRGPVAGSLAFSEGEIDRTSQNVVFGAEVNGNVAVGGFPRDIEGVVVGSFSGDNAELASGFFIGEAGNSLPLLGVIAGN